MEAIGRANEAQEGIVGFTSEPVLDDGASERELRVGAAEELDEQGGEILADGDEADDLCLVGGEYLLGNNPGGGVMTAVFEGGHFIQDGEEIRE